VESLHGHGAARLGEDQFALIRPTSDTPDHMAGRLERAATAAGAAVNVRAASLTLTPESANLHVLRALRFALDSFLKDGAITAKTAFNTVLENTMTQAHAFSTLVKERKFHMVYQPVVELTTAELHHFEALVRLEDERSPAKTIRMAEELEIIEDLDLAVISKVIATLKDKGNSKLRLAANISARSLMRPSFMPAMLNLITSELDLSSRLSFEITESAVLDDLDLANTNIQRIRQHGFGVSLDDFGAGAASMAYLRALSVDSVKIDGQYVKDLADSSRDGALVRHIKQLCDELGVETIAVMVETSQTAEALVAIGVTYGQGWHFGKPSPEPTYQKPAVQRARRVGEVETWG
jgi:EAL domain-containing protein (putative c-di-GMP-specific phosphodiesterase class I)